MAAVSPHVISAVGHLPVKFVKHIFRHFIFILFLLVFVASFFGCSAQSQNLTNVVQTQTTKPSPTPLPLPNNTNSSEDLPPITFLVIKGVSLGTSYQTVIRQLGKPLSSKKGGTNPCGGTKQVLRYSGLTITLDEDEDRQNIVVLIEITSPKWEVTSGINTSASLEDVRAKFGQSDEPITESGLEILTYGDGDGYVKFYFRNKKLVKVERNLNLC